MITAQLAAALHEDLYCLELVGAKAADVTWTDSKSCNPLDAEMHEDTRTPTNP